MAENINTLTKYLDLHRWKYSLNKERNTIITGVKSEYLEHLKLIIKLSENGEYFEVIIPNILTNINNCLYEKEVFKTITIISNENKMIKLDYDRIIDSVNAKICLPIEDGNLTYTQFERCLDSLVDLVEEVILPRLLNVMEAGEDYSDLQLGEKLLLKLEETLPQGYLSLIEKALSARLHRGLKEIN